jgi:hypothetical protein
MAQATASVALAAAHRAMTDRGHQWLAGNAVADGAALAAAFQVRLGHE